MWTTAHKGYEEPFCFRSRPLTSLSFFFFLSQESHSRRGSEREADNSSAGHRKVERGIMGMMEVVWLFSCGRNFCAFPVLYSKEIIK